MTERPVCIVKRCKNLAKQHHKRKDGSWAYGKLCDSHHRKKYNIPWNISPSSKAGNHNKKKYGETLKIDRSICVLCGWDKAPCDRHRIKFGQNGDGYTLGNIIILCPNCHRLIHMGLLEIS